VARPLFTCAPVVGSRNAAEARRVVVLPATSSPRGAGLVVGWGRAGGGAANDFTRISVQYTLHKLVLRVSTSAPARASNSPGFSLGSTARWHADNPAVTQRASHSYSVTGGKAGFITDGISALRRGVQ
jgi:hypothetical protein